MDVHDGEGSTPTHRSIITAGNRTAPDSATNIPLGVPVTEHGAPHNTGGVTCGISYGRAERRHNRATQLESNCADGTARAIRVRPNHYRGTIRAHTHNTVRAHVLAWRTTGPTAGNDAEMGGLLRRTYCERHERHMFNNATYSQCY